MFNINLSAIYELPPLIKFIRLQEGLETVPVEDVYESIDRKFIPLKLGNIDGKPLLLERQANQPDVPRDELRVCVYRLQLFPLQLAEDGGRGGLLWHPGTPRDVVPPVAVSVLHLPPFEGLHSIGLLEQLPVHLLLGDGVVNEAAGFDH